MSKEFRDSPIGVWILDIVHIGAGLLNSKYNLVSIYQWVNDRSRSQKIKPREERSWKVRLHVSRAILICFFSFESKHVKHVISTLSTVKPSMKWGKLCLVIFSRWWSHLSDNSGHTFFGAPVTLSAGYIQSCIFVSIPSALFCFFNAATFSLISVADLSAAFFGRWLRRCSEASAS